MRIRTIFFCMSAVICLTSCGSKDEKKQQEPANVVTEIVSAGNPSDSNSYVGEVEPKTTTTVSFTGSGTVNKVLVNNGQYVRKGQLIAVMDPTQCQNSVKAAQAVMTQAKDAYSRMKILHEKKSLSEMDWVEAQSKLTQAESSLLIAKKMLSDCNLIAPCSGVIGKKMLESGQVALPSQPVCTILSVDNVKIKVSIPEKEIGGITDNVKSTINVLALGKSFVGGKIEKEIEADAVSRTYIIRINMKNQDSSILPGMVCDVILNNGMSLENSHDIYVPITAVQRKAGGEMYVWHVENGRTKRIGVTVGNTSGNYIAIKSGLNKGDKIIVKGFKKLNDGGIITENNNR